MKIDVASVLAPFQRVRTSLKQNAPDCLFGFGIITSVAACVEFVKATPKAEKLVAEKNAKTVPEKICAAYEPFILPTALEIASIGSMMFSRKLTLEKLTALAGACSVSSAGLKKAEEVIQQKSSVDEYVNAKKDILDTQKEAGSSIPANGFLCHEQFTGRTFRATPDELRYIQLDAIAQQLEEKRYDDEDEGFVDLDYILKKFFKDENYDSYVGAHTRIMYDRTNPPFDYTAAYYDEKYGEFVVDIIYTMSNIEQLA